MQIAREYGVRPTPERTVQMRNGNWSPEVGYEPARRLTQATRDFTALICFNDTTAIGAIRALHEVTCSALAMSPLWASTTSSAHSFMCRV